MQTFAQPPILRGTEKEQLVQMRQYLYRISIDLNTALTNLTAENFAPGSAAADLLGGKGAGGQTSQTDNKGLSELKSLIIKTADQVRAEIDVLETNLASTYVAQSEFGTFSENITTQITDTAENVQRTIDYQATLADDFNNYKIATGGYIKQGIIGYKDAVPIIGIAIGQDIQVKGTDIKDGTEYEVIDMASNMSVWTPEKLAFYVNGMEAAYVSNGAFYADDMYILSRLFLNNWQISSNRGLTIKWIGG